jgi:hypothetical protein
MYLSPGTLLIIACGGVRATARRFGSSPSDVVKWRERGIPKRILLEAMDLVDAGELSITLIELRHGRVDQGPVQSVDETVRTHDNKAG